MFDGYRDILAEEPGLPDVFRTVLARLTATRGRTHAPTRVIEFVEWNIETLDRCIADESVADLMAWENTVRNFLIANCPSQPSKLYAIVMSRLNRLVFAHTMQSFAHL